jgi:hypothetical protein
MAIKFLAEAHYRCEVKVISRAGSSGALRSAAGTVAYRVGMNLVDQRSGEVQDYTRKRGVLREMTHVIAPAGSPAWLLDPAQIAAATDKIEKRPDAQLFRELLIDLPEELTLQQQMAALDAFLREKVVSMGMVVIVTIHEPHGPELDEAPADRRHTHVLATMRRPAPDEDGFGPKAREWNDRGLAEKWRHEWADYENAALEKAGRRERCSPKKIRDQAIDAGLDPDGIDVPLPQPKRGPADWRGRDDRKRIWGLWEEAEAARKKAVELRDRELELDAELEEARQVAAQEAEQTLGRIRDHAAAAARDQAERERQDVEKVREREIAKALRKFREQPAKPLRPAVRPPVVPAIAPADARVRANWLEARLTGQLRDFGDTSKYLAQYWRPERLPDGSRAYNNKLGRIVDVGDRVMAAAGNDLEIRAMLELAKLKQWVTITFTGNDDFRRRAMAAALEVAGLEVIAAPADAAMLADVKQQRQQSKVGGVAASLPAAKDEIPTPPAGPLSGDPEKRPGPVPDPRPSRR